MKKYIALATILFVVGTALLSCAFYTAVSLIVACLSA